MTPPLATTWDTMSDDDRWLILNKTDLSGLQKCTAAAQPFGAGGKGEQMSTNNEPKQQPSAWPKENDVVLHEGTGKEGQVLSNINGKVRVDWGLYITTERAEDLEPVI